MNRFAVILLLAAVFAGCDTRGPHADKEVISYTRWGNPSETESTRALIAQFEEQNPHIKVNVDVVSWDQYWTKMKAAVATGTAQDVWLLSPSYTEEYVNAGALLDLTDYFENDLDMDIDEFFRQEFDDFCFEQKDRYWRPVPYGKGRIFALARDYNCQLLYYNRDHFDAAGIPYPDGSWTWTDLVAVAHRLTVDFDNDGLVDQWGYGGLNYQALAHTNGGMFLDVERVRGTYASPRPVEAITFCRDLIHRYHVHPAPSLQVDTGTNFRTGRTSMTINGSWMIDSFNDSDVLWDVAPIPVDVPGRLRHNCDGGIAHGIYAKSRHREAAWKLVKFLSSETSQRSLARSGTSVPVLKRAALSDDFLAPFDRPRRQSRRYILEALEAPRCPRRAPKGFLEYTEYATQLLDAVWRNGISPDQACLLIDAKTDAVLNKHYGDARP